jgi:hypothetical protein
MVISCNSFFDDYENAMQTAMKWKYEKFVGFSYTFSTRNEA